MKIAEVIPDSKALSIDRVFHYGVPDDTDVKPGARVEVPFGFGNRSFIGYCIGFVQSTPYKELKTIKKVIDPVPIIGEKQIELAKYLRHTCFCSMSEAFRLMLPPRVNYAFEKVAVLKNNNFEGLTSLQLNIAENLASAGGTAEVKKLLESCGAKSSSVISSLEKKGIIEVLQRTVGGNHDKIRKKVTLIADEEEAFKAAANGKSMKKAVEMLTEYGSMLLSELISFSGCSAGSIKSLESKGVVEVSDCKVFRSPLLDKNFEKTEKLPPTEEQKTVIDALDKAVKAKKTSEHLLFGVTGSGKTEVFLQVAQNCVETGRSVIILVPEIALTPLMTNRFISRFGNKVAVLHSGLSLGERLDEWNRIKNGDVVVAVGARSAVFSPFDNVGLIVIDEEHEDTYKSESNPKYDARSVAKFRAEQENCPVLYASATPRVEDYYAAKCGKINLHRLTKRYNEQVMPKVSVADMAKELAEGNRSVYSRRALEEIGRNIELGQQSIVFLNRRGFSTFVSCRSCGYVAKCPHCSVSLTYHIGQNNLKCHMCGFVTANPVKCPDCGSKYIKYFGAGTQKAEDELKNIFKNITYVRMDADTTSHKFSHEKLLDKFSNEKCDVLLGTQMITKGLDFHGVTLSVVLAADTLLNMGDYKSSERAFSSLVQVFGRAGRGETPGRAIVQTYEPKNKVIAFAAKNDYEGFYGDEIASRKLMEYPPFSRMIYILFTGTDERKTGEYALKMQEELREMMRETDIGCKAFFGVTPATVFKIKNKFRYKIILKTGFSGAVYDLLEKLYDKHIENKTAFGMDIDINPTSCL